MLNGLQPWHLIILVLIVVLLFGAKRLPDAARSVGKSMKIFKAETKSMQDEDAAEEPEKKQLSAPSATPQANSDQQVADLQRQLDELKKQQEQQKHAS
ncbi:twin-arginine translocase TatA/TatE family subunit [Amycolatopsis acidicola]|uniref:Sec-independent protein translocase protein TatA n=1 Tax=Amycolatopsis acidicola TaxID=2596893 RepID=A0A5N0USW8_9PSEU|nr:Sec-independent protein translocase subunit TatA [Amycolatopsis acidicola]KAA9152185.1 twin-arginine translocase TatA/TatE family subunit [Amycolatopsis acidicola]